MPKVNSRGSLRLIFVSLLLMVIGGCASYDKENMVVQDYATTLTHPNTISVSVGNENSDDSVGGWVSVPPQDLLYAIEESIRKGRVFEEVVSGDLSDYLLNVTVFSLQQPAMGFNMTVKIEAGWTLTKAKGDTVWQKMIKSEFSLGVGDVFSGAERLQMCNDGAIRENISQGMAELSKLSL